MARLILDTGALIAIERGQTALPADDDLAIAAITASELLVGVALADSSRRAGKRSAAVEAILAVCEVIPFDLTAARQHARLAAHVRRAGSRRGAHDLIIAATAAASGRVVVTTDATGFAGLPDVAWRTVG